MQITIKRNLDAKHLNERGLSCFACAEISGLCYKFDEVENVYHYEKGDFDYRHHSNLSYGFSSNHSLDSFSDLQLALLSHVLRELNDSACAYDEFFDEDESCEDRHCNMHYYHSYSEVLIDLDELWFKSKLSDKKMTFNFCEYQPHC